VWDGLAKTSRDDVLLVESKAHIGEQASPACKASGAALLAIRERLEETKRYLQVRSEADWSGTYYQYANRLAHLYGLRVLNDYPVWLVFLYFVNASDVHGPKSAQEWKSAIKDLHDHLGIVGHSLMNYVVEIFVDVNRLNLDSGGG
jgi:hypothetical protein